MGSAGKRLRAYKPKFLITLLLLVIVPLALFQLYRTHTLKSQAQTVDTAFSFGVGGDFGANSNTSAVLNAVGAAGLNFFLAIGDFSYNQVTPESAWCDYVKQRVGQTFPFELISGNHEDDGPDGQIANFAACLPDRIGNAQGVYSKEYYFDYPTVNPVARFIMISPNLTFPNEGTYSYAKGSTRYNWTAQAIDQARAAGIKWIIVGMHKYCIAMVSGTCQVGNDIMNLLVSKKVDLYLQAHDHAYYRSKQLAHTPTCSALSAGSYNAGCVVDTGSDGGYDKNAGTVLLTIGSSGRSINSVYTTDPEAPYFVSWMGNNFNPTYGFMKFTVSQTQLSGQYVGASGGTFTDSFTITDTSVPPTPTPTEDPTLPTATPTDTPLPTNTPIPTNTPTPTPTSAPGSEMSLQSVADTFVARNATGTNYGTSTSLYVDASPIKISYLKFDLSSIAGRTVTAAKLRIKTVNNTFAGSPNTQVVKIVDDTSWTETSVTYNTKPPLSSTVLGSIANTAGNTVYEISLDPAPIQAKIATGMLGVGIDSAGSDAFYFSSRETVDKPTLILTLQI